MKFIDKQGKNGEILITQEYLPVNCIYRLCSTVYWTDSEGKDQKRVFWGENQQEMNEFCSTL